MKKDVCTKEKKQPSSVTGYNTNKINCLELPKLKGMDTQKLNFSESLEV